MTKQLNVRSERAYGTALRIAVRLGPSTAPVVEKALDPMERDYLQVPTYDDLNPVQRAFADEMPALARKGRGEGDRDATSNHDYLYDAIGAPK